jgi:NAD-dependent dihydropyrimidine dehydrogenase PreA subunit
MPTPVGSPGGVKVGHVASISIDEDVCARDGLCARICPTRVFTPTENGAPRIGHEAPCCLCGQCLAACPSGAISHSLLDGSQFEKITDRHPVESGNDGRCGPTRGRRFPGSFWSRSWRWAASVPPGPTALPDMEMRLAEYDRGHDVITYDAPAALFVHSPRVTPTPQTDCDCVMCPMMLMAHALGLGTCWNGYLSRAASGFRLGAFAALREMLPLPDHHDVYAAATIGYPAFTLHSVPQREISAHWVAG